MTTQGGSMDRIAANTPAERMREAASHLRFAAELLEAEADWLERNPAWLDDASYIAASLASREQEAKHGLHLALGSLQG